MMLRGTFTVFLFLFSYCFCFLSPCSLALARVVVEKEVKAKIVIEKEVNAKHDKVTLADIAEIFSEDPEVIERLSAISFGYAPQLGLARELTKEQIVLSISAAGFANNDLQLEIPHTVLVRRANQVLTSEIIYQEVEKTTLSDLIAAGATARLVKLEIPTSFILPTGDVLVKVNKAPVKDLFSPFAVQIEIYVDLLLVKRLSAMTQIEAFAPLVIINKSLPAGAKLKETDVTIEAKKLTKPINNYLQDIRLLKGAALTRAVSQGEALLKDQLVPAFVVKPGDLVKVIATNKKLSIEVQGEARTAGRIGDRVKIKSTLSETFLDAIVEDEGQVKVNF